MKEAKAVFHFEKEEKLEIHENNTQILFPLHLEKAGTCEAISQTWKICRRNSKVKQMHSKCTTRCKILSKSSTRKYRNICRKSTNITAQAIWFPPTFPPLNSPPLHLNCAGYHSPISFLCSTSPV